MNRRTFLKGAGAASVALAGGGAWRAHDQGVFNPGVGPAYQPWQDWQNHPPGSALGMVAAAILAANPHNTQPWAFQTSDATIELFAETGRNLGAFDPFLREMYIGLGCALENLVIAAGEGVQADVQYVAGRLDGPPEAPERVLAAKVLLEPGQNQSEHLHEFIPHRHTNRGPYDCSREVPRDVLDSIVSHSDPNVRVFLFTDAPKRQALGNLVVRATEAIVADEEMVHASERWFRHRRSEIDRFRDGPTLDAAGLSPLTTSIAKLLPRPSAEANHKYWLDATRNVQVPTAPVLGLLAVRDLYDREQNLRAGRLWQRMHLRATAHKLSMQPLNQPVEFVDRERDLGREPRMARELDVLTESPGWKSTFLFRAGFAARDAMPSPRRSVEMVHVLRPGVHRRPSASIPIGRRV